MLASFLPPIGCCDSAYYSARRATPCWASDVSPDVRCTCSASPNVPTRRRNATPALRAIIECHKLDRSCDLLLTLDRCVWVFWGQFLLKHKVHFYTSIKSFLCPVHHQQHNQFFVNFRPLNLISARRMRTKKIREPIDAFLTATNGIVLLWLCRLYLHDRPKRDRNVQNGLNWNISSSANSFFCFNCIINFYCNPFFKQFFSKNWIVK